MNTKIKNLIIVLVLFIVSETAISQPIVKDELLPQGTVVYALPTTTLNLKVVAERETFTAGPYAKYAQKYLGVAAEDNNSVSYKIIDIELTPYIEADKDISYAINLGAIKAASGNYLEFTNNGLIMWSDSYSGKNEKFRFSSQTKGNFDIQKITENLVSEKSTLYKTVQSSSGVERVPVQQTQLVEKSLEKKAEEIANLIFKLKSKRLDIITGETDANYSGEAMRAALDEISRLESEYASLFLGKSTYDTQSRSFDVAPAKENTKQIYIAFRISESEGIVSPDNLSGRPIIVEIKPLKGAAFDFEMDMTGTKIKSIYYRKPAISVISIMDGNKQLLQTRVPIYQFGKTLSFPIEISVSKW